MLQLKPQIPVKIVDKKNERLHNKIGQAIGWLDYSEEHDIFWIVALDETGEVWTVPNPKIRLLTNYTMGRK